MLTSAANRAGFADFDPVAAAAYFIQVLGQNVDAGSAVVVYDNSRIWATTGGAPAAVRAAGDADVNEVAFSPDGSVLAVATDTGGVRLWRRPTG